MDTRGLETEESFAVVPPAPPPPEARPFPFEAPTGTDRRVVEERQLRHRASQLIGVARRCRHGLPQVLVYAPIRLHGRRVRAESSLLWLSCPLLVRAVDRLETEGLIEKLSARVREDEALRRELEAVEKEIPAVRAALIPPDWHRRLERDPTLRQHRFILFRTSLAGITKVEHVKCLHAHLADYLARGRNPVGRIVAEELGRRGIPLAGTEACRGECALE